MAVLNPDHLFEQAERLILPPPHGPPRQVDVRRAISDAYYALFHFILISAANEFVGAIHQGTGRYGLVYRSIEHRALNTLCGDVLKHIPPLKYATIVSPGGFGSQIKAFALAARELQQMRLLADYDPAQRFKTANAQFAIRAARQAVATFQQAPEPDRKTFLTLLVCPPR